MFKASRAAAVLIAVLFPAMWMLAQDPQSSTVATLKQMQESLRRLEAEVVSLRATVARLTAASPTAASLGAVSEPNTDSRASVFQRSQAAYVEGTRLEGDKLYRAAIENFSLALQLDSRNDSAWLHRGSCYYQLGEYSDAEADFSRALSVQPNNSRAYLARASARAAKGNNAAAMSDVNEAIRRDSRNPEAYLLRGRMYQQQGDSDKSLADYGSVLALTPNSEKAYLGRAAVLLRDGFADRAMIDCDNAVRANTNSFAAYLCRAQSYVEQGQPERAIGEINRASLTAQQLGQPLGFLNDTWQSLQPPADDSPAATVSVNPTVPAADAATPKEAPRPAEPPASPPKPTVSELLRPLPAPPAPKAKVAVARGAAEYETLGRSSSQSAMWEDALAALNRSIEIDPQRATAFNARGYVELLMRQFNPAISDFSEAVRLNSAYANAYHNRAVARRRTGDIKGAAEDDRTASALASRKSTPPVTARR